MSYSLIINDETGVDVAFDVALFFKSVLMDQGINDGTFELNFVNADTIVEINLAHLGRDYVTDVITYNLAAPGSPIEADIYICLDQVADNARALGHSFEFELHIVITHSVLHCLGFGDATPEEKAVMDGLQLAIVQRLAD